MINNKRVLVSIGGAMRLGYRCAREAAHRLDPENWAQPPGIGLLNAIMSAYWHAARRLL